MKFWFIVRVLVFCLFLAGCSERVESATIWFVPVAGDGGLHSFNPFTGQDRVIIHADEGVGVAGLSPDRKRIAYLAYENNASSYVLWLANADGSDSHLIDSDLNPQQATFIWLDNEHLAIASLWENCCANPDDPFRWKLYDLTRSTLSSLGTNNQPIRAPFDSYHLNPQVLILNSEIENPPLGVVHWQVEGNFLHQVLDYKVDPSLTPAHVGDGHFGSVTPDGQLIAFSGEGSENIMDIFLASDHGKTVRNLTDFQRNYIRASVNLVSLSPNGRWLLAQVSPYWPRTPGLAIEGQMVLIPTDGTPLKFLIENNGPIQGNMVWSPDSRYAAFSNGEIYLVDVETVSVKQLTSDGTNKFLYEWR